MQSPNLTVHPTTSLAFYLGLLGFEKEEKYQVEKEAWKRRKWYTRVPDVLAPIDLPSTLFCSCPFQKWGKEAERERWAYRGRERTANLPSVAMTSEPHGWASLMIS